VADQPDIFGELNITRSGQPSYLVMTLGDSSCQLPDFENRRIVVIVITQAEIDGGLNLGV
jgi:hypothetical protein